MTHKFKQLSYILILSVASVGFSFDTGPIKPQLRKLSEHLPSALSQQMEIGKSVEPETQISLSIALSWNQEKNLNQTLVDLYDPSSSSFHKFLTSSEFRQKFAPTEAQITQVQGFLELYGIQPLSVSDNRLVIHAIGTAREVNEAFHTELVCFTDKQNQRYFAPIRDLQVPIDSPIQAVFGVENITKAHHHLRKRENLEPVTGQSLVGTGPRGGFSPSDLKSAYGLSLPLNGAHQTLALFELDGFDKNDITAYAKYFKLRKVPLKTIKVDGVTGKPGDGAGEVTLDIELMTAIAPGAKKILVYEGPNTAEGLINTYNKIATDNCAKVVSTSWGLTENQASPAMLQSENNIFKQMAAQGQAIYAASGDSGAFDNGKDLGVDDPASQPYVVAVGGTQLSLNQDGTYFRETTWNQNNTSSGGASGGGISSMWPIAEWQKAAVNPASKGSTTNRNVPDVALNADPNTGYAIFFKGQWNVFGGTSCAAPLWAAFNALVNQNRTKLHLSVLGFPSPALYTLGQSSFYSTTFHDITDGSTNLWYPAVTGLDNATGWGSFYGEQLIQNLSTH
ncbi:MAG: S53 family peptidase [Bdellovibrionia bacterium]